MTKIEPGWYRDPAAPETQRYWDGEQWVGKPVGIDETPPSEPEPLPPPEPEPQPEAEQSGSGKPGSGKQDGPIQVDSALGPYMPGGPLARQLDYKSVERILRGRVLAHPGQRLVARLIDICLVGLLAAVVNSWFLYQYYAAIKPAVDRMMRDPTVSAEELIPSRAYELQFLIIFITILVWFAYEVPSTVNSGQTVGKRLMGIQAIPLGGHKMRWSLAIARWSLMMLAFACFPVGVLLAIVDGLWCLRDRPFKQCLHDKNAGTMVIDLSHSEGDAHVPPDAPRS